MVRMCHWSLPSKFMRAGVELGVTLIVFERYGPAGNVEDEGAEGAVVVLPAAVVIIEIVPGELLDRGFQTEVVDRLVRVLRRQLYFAAGWQRDLFIGGVPGLDALDLAGITAAVVVDSHAVNADFGQGVEYQVLVARAGDFGRCAGLDFGRVVHG